MFKPTHIQKRLWEAVSAIEKRVMRGDHINLLDPEDNEIYNDYKDAIKMITEEVLPILPKEDTIELKIILPLDMFDTDEKCIEWNEMVEKEFEKSGIKYPKVPAGNKEKQDE